MDGDVAIIGGGIVGLATALALTEKRPGIGVTVIEKESAVACHQTGHNSGVIHSGLYYNPGSLKARNCARGREMLYRFCEQHGVPHERCGKLVVATNRAQLPALEELHRRGAENGLKNIRRLGPEEIREREPHTAGVAALFIQETGIVDFRAVAEKYAELIQQRGCSLLTGARVVGILSDGRESIIETTRGPLACKVVVNCAGLYSDVIARMAGVHPRLRVVPFRGEYYELKPASRHLVRHLIYPVPDPRFPFLGVHFTRMIGGGVEAGPNAVLAFAREGYSHSRVSIRDLAGMAAYPGFWRMAVKYWRTGAAEFRRSLSKRAFTRALQALVPDIRESDLVRGGAGVRAQALLPDGRLADDFRIIRHGNAIHVLNTPSPAATASLSIGELIARRVVGMVS